MQKGPSYLVGLVALIAGYYLVSTGCVKNQCVYSETIVEALQPPLPVATLEMPRPGYQPASTRFKLAVMNFTDQTGAAGDLTRSIPDIISTALYKRNRFDLLDRGQLREKTSDESMAEVQSLGVEGLLFGAITQFRTKDKVVVCDIRIINRYTKVVMYAQSAEFRYSGKLELNLNRKDVGTLAERISDRFPKLDAAFEVRVLEVDREKLVINAGADKKLINGMVLLVEAPTDLKTDPDSGQVLSSKQFVAEVTLTSIEARTSRGKVVPKTGEVRVGDRLIAK